MEPRNPVPPLVVLAMVGAALALGLPSLALTLLLSFHCLLRPVEGISIAWRDLRLESQLTYYPELESFGVLIIQQPKTRKTGPRRQHVVIFDQLLLDTLGLAKLLFSSSSLLYQGGTAGFRMDFAAVLDVPWHPSGDVFASWLKGRRGNLVLAALPEHASPSLAGPLER